MKAEELFKQTYGRTIEEANTSYNGHDMVKFAEEYAQSLLPKEGEVERREIKKWIDGPMGKPNTATHLKCQHCDALYPYQPVLDGRVDKCPACKRHALQETTISPKEGEEVYDGEWTMPEGTYLRLMGDLCTLLGEAWGVAEKKGKSFGEWYVGISPKLRGMITKSYSTKSVSLPTEEEIEKTFEKFAAPLSASGIFWMDINEFKEAVATLLKEKC